MTSAMRRHRGLGLTAIIASATCFDIIGWFLPTSNRQWQNKLTLVTAPLAGQRPEARLPENSGRVLDSEELIDLLQQPGAADDVREIAQQLFSDPKRRQKFNSTLTKLAGALGPAGLESEDEVDTLTKMIADPTLLSGLQDPSTSTGILADLNRSALFDEMRVMGSYVIEQVQIKNLPAGQLVEITGLESQPQLNGVVGKL